MVLKLLVFLISFSILNSNAVALSAISPDVIKAPADYKMEKEILVSGDSGLEALVNEDGITIRMDTEDEIVEAKIEKTNNRGLESASPRRIRQVLNRVGSTGYNLGKYAVLQYPAEALGFYLALTAMSVWECMVNVNTRPSSGMPLNLTTAENPMACTELMQSLRDPVTHVSFAIFIQTNKHTASLLSRYHKQFKARYGRSYIPASMAKYLGLAAGSLVSTLASEFMTDPNIRYIAANFFRDKNPIEQRRFDSAMDNAYDKWISSNITVYGHHVVSLLASAVTASLVTSMGTKIFRSLQSVYGRSGKNKKLSANDVPIPDEQLLRHGQKIVKRFKFPYLKFSVMALSRTTGTAILAFEVASLLHFFFWQYTVYGPFTKKLLMQEESSAELKFYQSEIMKYLAYANKKEGSFYLQAKTPVRNLVYDNLHTREQIDIRNNYLQSNNEVCGYDLSEDNKLTDFKKKSESLIHKSILQSGYQYTKQLCPSLVQLPNLLNRDFTKNLNQVVDVTEVAPKSDETIQDMLLDNISKHQEMLIKYYGAIGERMRHLYESWRTFF